MEKEQLYNLNEPLIIDSSYAETAKKKYREALDIPTELIERLRDGDNEAFDRLYALFAKPLYDFILRFIANKEEAREIVHETFTRLIEKRESIDTGRSVKGLMYSTAKFLAISYLRHRNAAARYLTMPDSELGFEAGYDNTMIEREVEEMIEFIIESQPERRKQIILMHRDQGLSAKEIAVRLGITERAVRLHISSFKKDLLNTIPIILLFLYL